LSRSKTSRRSARLVTAITGSFASGSSAFSTIPCSSLKSRRCRSDRLGDGRPITRSISPVSSSSVRGSCPPCLTVSSTPGCSLTNVRRDRATVVVAAGGMTPSRKRPVSPREACFTILDKASERSTRARASGNNARPAIVNPRIRLVRSNNGEPISASSWRICAVSAG